MAFCWNNERVYITSSDDDGLTWAPPREITQDVKPSGWTWYATGPGHGIQMRDGRLIVPSDHREGARGGWPFVRSHVVFSDDHGATWKLRGTVAPGTDECMAVETEDGRLYMSMRPSKKEARRRMASWSTDGGLTWGDSTEIDTLPDAVYQASIVRYTTLASNGKSRVLFANPAGDERNTMTVRISYDECASWPVSRVIHSGPSSYSDLTVAPDNTIACLYERGNFHRRESIRLAQFNLEWLTEGADRL